MGPEQTVMACNGALRGEEGAMRKNSGSGLCFSSIATPLVVIQTPKIPTFLPCGHALSFKFI